MTHRPTKAPATAARLQQFGTSVFSEMTALAVEHGAVNLSQGTPGFEGPPEIVAAAMAELRAGRNQYVRSMGEPELVEALADKAGALYGLELDPMSEITVTCGATEGIASSLLGFIEPGDEVILFEPFYDSYPVLVTMAGAKARYYTLRFPDFTVDFDELGALFSDRTRLIVLNTPHNPTGKVFTRRELDAIAALCMEHDVICLSDEVYEHMVYDASRHVPMATVPGMFERTLTLSSAGKTYSLTGWKVGWAMGPAHLVAATQAAHQFVTFCTPGALQRAMAFALREFSHDYYEQLQRDYAGRRSALTTALRSVGFEVAMPDGTYFALADFTSLFDGDDRSFARHLVEHVGVAAIPPSGFYHDAPEEGHRLLRFSFCQDIETLGEAAERLRRLRA